MAWEFDTVKSGSQIYLDHNATAPLAKAVRDRIDEWLLAWGNPSSIHQSGRGPKALIREARAAVAELVGCHPLEIVFTSGGSEANNLALKGTWFDSRHRSRKRYITSAVEHPSVMKTFEFLRQQGADVQVVSVNRDGEMDLAEYEALLAEAPTALVSIMYGNNETGNIFPIAKMVEMAHEHGALFHCDMVQALGKTELDLQELNVDFASFSAHKFYSLKGCGFLYIKKGQRLESLIHGGAQERARRAGTENALAIAALGEMAKSKSLVPKKAEEMKLIRNHIQTRMEKEIENISFTGCRRNFSGDVESFSGNRNNFSGDAQSLTGNEKNFSRDADNRLPNTLSAVIPGVDGETLLMNLDMKGFAVSTGAACSSGSPEPSPVLLAMGLSREEAQSSLRLSVGWGTTLAQADAFVDTLVKVVKRLRSFQHGEKAAHGL